MFPAFWGLKSQVGSTAKVESADWEKLQSVCFVAFVVVAVFQIEKGLCNPDLALAHIPLEVHDSFYFDPPAM